MEKIRLNKVLANKELLETFNDPIYIVGSDRDFLYFNYQYLSLTGLSPREIKSKKVCKDCFSMDICKDKCVYDECVRTGQIIQLREVGAKDKEGNKLSFWVSAIPLFAEDDKPAAVMAVLRDMTVEAGVHGKYKTLYERERNAKIHLEEVVKDRTKELRTANLKLKLINKKLEEFSIKDALTDLYNYRYFFEEISVLFKEAQRYNRPLSCLLLDIDYFKSANDNYSHQFGDFILRRLGSSLKTMLKKDDVLARYGGDEFVILLPNVYYKQAYSLAKMINKKIRSETFKEGGCSKKITISIGVSAYPDDKINDKDQLVKFADTALYKAKRSGKDTSYCYKDIRKRKQRLK